MSNFRKSLHRYFQEYCENTSIHGFKYLGEKRTIFEKIWWTIVMLICLSLCILSIYTVYKKWEHSPVVVTFANKETPIYEIPFPSVTICPETKSSKKIFNFTNVCKDYKNSTLEQNPAYDYFSLICINSFCKSPNTTTVSEDFYNYVDNSQSVFPIFSCKYNNKKVNCRKNFSPIFTEEGVCYSFNMLDRNDLFRENVIHYKNYHQFNSLSNQWSIDSGYSNKTNIFSYPRRALLSGASGGLSVELIGFSENLEYMCKESSIQGYKVVVHSPTDYPLPNEQYFRVPIDESVIVAIQPSMITTSQAINVYSVNRRRCYFQSERYLRYFKVYTANNCDRECLTNYTLDLCDCVGFSMPRDNNNTKICGPGMLDCMKEAKIFMQLKNLNHKFDSKKKYSGTQTDCDCLPLCTGLNYDFETSQSDWDWKSTFAALNLDYVNSEIHMSLLEIYFKKDDFITSERNEFYGPIDFLANFGGILGLFTGVSVLSILEILYFSTIRIVCNRWLYGKWSITKKEN